MSDGNYEISDDYPAIHRAFVAWLNTQDIGLQDGIAMMLDVIVAKLLESTDSEANFRECVYMTIKNFIFIAEEGLKMIKKGGAS
jgi:hypothetical protein